MFVSSFTFQAGNVKRLMEEPGSLRIQTTPENELKTASRQKVYSRGLKNNLTNRFCWRVIISDWRDTLPDQPTVELKAIKQPRNTQVINLSGVHKKLRMV
ncbi:hypothetical protein AVEN_110607-1 [Araneus ventricosus]|uniref:Uncharacterized protein n=1 Tax=Araneus ventricosus TaxID=182803 RepID=A0A4Y2ATC6_ARAVE|nr:hypothetical protein AVEN_110607-1 [Araneus ventricosus]